MSSSSISGLSILYPAFPEAYPTLEMLNDKPLRHDSKTIFQIAKHLKNDYLLQEQLIEVANRSMKDNKISIAGANVITALAASGIHLSNRDEQLERMNAEIEVIKRNERFNQEASSDLITHLSVPTNSVNSIRISQKPKIERMEITMLTPSLPINATINTHLIPPIQPSVNEDYSKIVEKLKHTPSSTFCSDFYQFCSKCFTFFCCCGCCESSCCSEMGNCCLVSWIYCSNFFCLESRAQFIESCGGRNENNCALCCWICLFCPLTEEQWRKL